MELASCHPYGAEYSKLSPGFSEDLWTHGLMYSKKGKMMKDALAE
jgi:hypothetical protein